MKGENFIPSASFSFASQATVRGDWDFEALLANVRHGMKVPFLNLWHWSGKKISLSVGRGSTVLREEWRGMERAWRNTKAMRRRRRRRR